MTPDHTMTLIQFRDAHRDEYYARGPARFSKARYNRFYKPESRYTEWYRCIERAVQSGQVIRRHVCDDLYRRAPIAWRHLVHDFGTDWLPKGYANPELRKQRKESHHASAI